MKYGIIVNGRVTEPVSIPSPLPSWAADDAAFLAKMFPTLTGWVAVPDDAVPGTVANQDGTFTNPSAPGPKPRVLGWLDLAKYLVGLMGGGDTGRAALGAKLKALNASASGADNYFFAYLNGRDGVVYTKDDLVDALSAVSTTIITAAQKTAVANNWPTNGG